MKSNLTFSIAFILFFINSDIICQTKYTKTNLFYLSVGSTHYVSNQFVKIPSANNSAKVFSKFMESFNSFGITLLSSSKEPVSKIKIIESINSIMDSVNNTSTGSNVLFVYLCGHGFADKNTKLQFFAPGNLNLNIFDNRNASQVRGLCISFYDLNRFVRNTKLSKLILVYDCCYDLAAPNPEFAYVELTLEERSKWPDSMKKTMSYFIIDQKDNRGRAIFNDENSSLCTILNAAQPGMSVLTVRHPFVNGKKKVGPVCRRILLADKKFPKDSVLLDSFVSELLNKDLDFETEIPKVLIRDYRTLGAVLTRRKLIRMK